MTEANAALHLPHRSLRNDRAWRTPKSNTINGTIQWCCVPFQSIIPHKTKTTKNTHRGLGQCWYEQSLAIDLHHPGILLLAQVMNGESNSSVNMSRSSDESLYPGRYVRIPEVPHRQPPITRLAPPMLYYLHYNPTGVNPCRVGSVCRLLKNTKQPLVSNSLPFPTRPMTNIEEWDGLVVGAKVVRVRRVRHATQGVQGTNKHKARHTVWLLRRNKW